MDAASCQLDSVTENSPTLTWFTSVYGANVFSICLPERLSLVGVIEKTKHFPKLGFSENEVIIDTLCPSTMFHFSLSHYLILVWNTQLPPDWVPKGTPVCIPKTFPPKATLKTTFRRRNWDAEAEAVIINFWFFRVASQPREFVLSKENIKAHRQKADT